jgi:hypothetical protein
MFRFAFVLLFAGLAAQGVAKSAAAGDDSSQKPSAIVSSALDVVAKAGSAVDLNKWKTPNTVRGEVDANLASIQKDLQTTLPPLLVTADAAPANASASLPVLLNLDALYSVLLRVTIASRAGAPREENVGLEQAAITLDNARRELGDRIMAAAVANEKRVAALQATATQQAAQLQALQSAAAAAPVAAAKKPVKKKVAAKAAAASAAKPAQ